MLSWIEKEMYPAPVLSWGWAIVQIPHLQSSWPFRNALVRHGWRTPKLSQEVNQRSPVSAKNMLENIYSEKSSETPCFLSGSLC